MAERLQHGRKLGAASLDALRLVDNNDVPEPAPGTERGRQHPIVAHGLVADQMNSRPRSPTQDAFFLRAGDGRERQLGRSGTNIGRYHYDRQQSRPALARVGLRVVEALAFSRSGTRWRCTCHPCNPVPSDARHPEAALGDDVALNLVRPARDRAGERAHELEHRAAERSSADRTAIAWPSMLGNRAP